MSKQRLFLWLSALGLAFERYKKMAILGAVLAAQAALAADPLLASRTPGGQGNWTGIAGIRGGIPSRTTVYQTLNPGDSVQTAYNNCPSNQVVLLNAGTYSGGLSLQRSDVTIRGSGAVTINGTIEIGDWHDWDNMHANPSSGNHVNWTGGLTQGSTNITVASTNGYSVGQLIVLDQLNDTNTTLAGVEGVTGFAYTSVAFPSDGRDRARHQMSRIYAITNNQITLSDPVYADFDSNLDPEVWRFPDQPVVRVGLENLTINGRVTIHNTSEVWLTNCIVRYAGSGDVGYLMVLWSHRTSIQHGRIVTSDSQPHEDYGFEVRASSAVLFEDNFVNYVGVPIQLSGLCGGSVVAYNVVSNSFSASSWMSLGLLQHGGFPWMTLVEGNVASCVGYDNTDSPSWCNTIHRNWAQGVDQARTAFGNVQAIEIEGTNRDFTVTGNVLGTAGVTYSAYQDGPGCSGGKRIYMIGFWRAECGSPYDPLVNSTLIRGWNWDQYNNAIIADGYTASDIPFSRYLSSKPAWFGNLAWPPISPGNPTYSRSMTNIPAYYRFFYNAEPPSGAPDTTPPTVASATVLANGTNIDIAFSEPCTWGAGGNGGFALSVAGHTLTYLSGNNSTTFRYSVSPLITNGFSATVGYTQPGNGVEDPAGNDLASFSGTNLVNNSQQPDTSPPTPNPPYFTTPPTPPSDPALSPRALDMVCVTASDVSGVQYEFDFVSGGSGGTDSGLQATASYQDTGLTAETAYTYRVRARDGAGNVTGWSTNATGTTGPNLPWLALENIGPAGGSGNNYSINPPGGVGAGIISNDCVFILILKENSDPVTWPSGFTNILTTTNNAAGQAHWCHLGWKRETGTPTAPYVATWATAEFRYGYLAVVRGARLSGNPYTTNSTAVKTTTSSTTLPDVAITTQTNNELVVWLGGIFQTASASTPPTGFTEFHDAGSSGINVPLTCAYKVQSAPGGVTATGSSYSGPNGSTTAILLSLAPQPDAPADSTAPTVTAFDVPATYSQLTVPITTFTATDAVGVTGYVVNESASTPSASDPNWSGTAQTTYTFTTPGAKTLYAWARDAAGNISTSASDTVAVTLPSGSAASTPNAEVNLFIIRP